MKNFLEKVRNNLVFISADVDANLRALCSDNRIDYHHINLSKIFDVSEFNSYINEIDEEVGYTPTLINASEVEKTTEQVIKTIIDLVLNREYNMPTYVLYQGFQRKKYKLNEHIHIVISGNPDKLYEFFRNRMQVYDIKDIK